MSELGNRKEKAELPCQSPTCNRKKQTTGTVDFLKKPLFAWPISSGVATYTAFLHQGSFILFSDHCLH